MTLQLNRVLGVGNWEFRFGGREAVDFSEPAIETLTLCRWIDAVSIADMHIELSEYTRLRAWFSHMVPKIFPVETLDPGANPVMVLDRMAKEAPAKARSGLGMAIGDVVELTDDWTISDVTTCDDELSKMDLPTLSEMRARFSKVILRVVRRGAIKNNDEFYALRNAVDQRGADTERLWSLLDAYEARI